MNRHQETQFYEVGYRAILSQEKKIKVFTEKSCIEVESEINFDLDLKSESSMDFFAASISGGIMKSIIHHAKKEKVNILEMESVIKIKLENPLVIIGVKGYEEEPLIKSCNLKLYLYSDLEENELKEFCNNTLKKSFIYNTLKRAMELNVTFISLI